MTSFILLYHDNNWKCPERLRALREQPTFFFLNHYRNCIGLPLLSGRVQVNQTLWTPWRLAVVTDLKCASVWTLLKLKTLVQKKHWREVFYWTVVFMFTVMMSQCLKVVHIESPYAQSDRYTSPRPTLHMRSPQWKKGILCSVTTMPQILLWNQWTSCHSSTGVSNSLQCLLFIQG